MKVSHALKQLLLAALLGAAIAAPKVHAEAQILNGMDTLISIYNQNRGHFYAPVSQGADAGLVCMDVVYLTWHDLYTPVVETMTPADLNSQRHQDFDYEADAATQEMTDVFDQYRPGLSAAVRTTLENMRKVNQAPALPEALDYRDYKKADYQRYMNICRSPQFWDAVSKLVPIYNAAQDGAVLSPTSYEGPATIFPDYQSVVDAIQRRR